MGPSIKTLTILFSLFCLISFVNSHESKDKTGHHTLDFEHEREHIKEHLEDIVSKNEDEMSDEELQFHYFKLHDYNNDNMLDGCEIFKAMSHAFRETPDNQEDITVKPVDIEPITKSVDDVLTEVDTNKDGYITYPEYKNRYVNA